MKPTIKATCPICGQVSLTPDGLELWVFPDGAEEDFYAFDCPDCGDREEKPADARIVRLLRNGGVEPVEVAVHPESPPVGLPPVTRDELLDFHEQLQDEAYLAAAAMSLL